MSENPAPGEIELLEKLALGLLVYPGDPRTSEPRLFLGKIPENLPIEVPIPEQSRVVGTLARSETHVEIVLESDLTPEEVFSFYRVQLTSLGWHELEDMWPHHAGGFLHSDFGPHMNITFCQGSDGAGLMLNIAPLESTTTHVRLDLSLDREIPHSRKREFSDGRKGVEKSLVEEVRVGEIRAAIAGLPFKQRAAVLMHKYEEMDYAQIAEVLGCTPSAVKALMFRAYESLRAQLAHLA